MGTLPRFMACGSFPRGLRDRQGRSGSESLPCMPTSAPKQAVVPASPVQHGGRTRFTCPRCPRSAVSSGYHGDPHKQAPHCGKRVPQKGSAHPCVLRVRRRVHGPAAQPAPRIITLAPAPPAPSPRLGDDTTRALPRFHPPLSSLPGSGFVSGVDEQRP